MELLMLQTLVGSDSPEKSSMQTDGPATVKACWPNVLSCCNGTSLRRRNIHAAVKQCWRPLGSSLSRISAPSRADNNNHFVDLMKL